MSYRAELPSVVVLAADLAAWERCGLLQVWPEAQAVELVTDAVAAARRGAVLALYRPAPETLRAAGAAGVRVLVGRLEEDLAAAPDAGGPLFELLVLPASTAEIVARMRSLAARGSGGSCLAAIDDRSLLRQRSRRDELTGLPGAWLFRDRLEQALLRSRRSGEHPLVAVLRVGGGERGELDSIHAARLRGIAARVRTAIRSTDTVAHEGHHGAVSRGAAPELLLLLPDLGVEGSRAVLERVRAIATTEPIDIPGQVPAVSIGYAVACDPAIEADALLQLARSALEGAAPGEIRNAADGAIAPIAPAGPLSGEIEVWYQPVVHDRDGVVGVEALARWRHPALGLLGAAELMLYALDNGLVEAVLREVLAQVTRQWRQWRDGAPGPIPILVPLTGAELRSGILVAAVAGALERHDVVPSQVTFEIAEDDLLASPAAVAVLRSLGCRITIDDFGAGPTALRSIDSADSPWIKIDRALIRRLPESSEALAAVRLLLSIARAAGVDAIAAGVESERQARALRALGCECFQGWEVGAPAPADGLVTRLRRDRTASREARVVPFRASV